LRPFRPDSTAGASLYPSRWEPYWLKEARRATGGGSDTKALNRLRPAVARLSDLYTKDRDAVTREIYRDAALRAAYGLYFFPRTYARMHWVWEEIERRCGWRPPEQGNLRLLDLGCGQGASTLALVDRFADRKLEVRAIDQSREHLQALEAIVRERPVHSLRLQTRTGNLRAIDRWRETPGGWHAITAGFALGEAFRGADWEAVRVWIESALEALHPEGLLVLVEPALRETSERLEQIRDHVSGHGLGRIVAPCPHAAACPLLAEGQYWCHEVRKWIPPAATEYLNRTLHRQVQLLKFSFLVLSRMPSHATPRPTVPTQGRLVSPVAKVAGRLVFSLCGDDGQTHTIDAQTRDLPAADRRRLQKVERGEWMQFEGLITLASGRHHRIGPETRWTVHPWSVAQAE